MIDDDRRPHNVIKISGKKKGKSMKVETLLWNAREAHLKCTIKVNLKCNSLPQ